MKDTEVASMSPETDRMYLTVSKSEMKGLEVGQEVTVHIKAKIKGLSEDQHREWNVDEDKPGKEVTVHEVKLEYGKEDVTIVEPEEENEFALLAEEDA